MSRHAKQKFCRALLCSTALLATGLLIDAAQADDIVNNGTLTYTGGTVSDNISGTGSVIIDGNVVFTGNNTYTGGTKLVGCNSACVARSLRIANTGMGTSIIGSFTRIINGQPVGPLVALDYPQPTLIFDRSDFYTFSGTTDQINAQVTGGGTMILTGTMTFPGSSQGKLVLTIDSGSTLQIGDGGTTGSIALTGSGLASHQIVNHGTLAINRSDTYTLLVTSISAELVGGGNLQQIGSGTTILSGQLGDIDVSNITVSHGTLALQTNLSNGILILPNSTFSVGPDGTLQIRDQDTGGLQPLNGQFTDNGNVTFGLQTNHVGFNGIFAGTVSGSGKITVDAESGTLTWKGTSSNTGGVTINSGTMVLSGTGSIAGDVVDNGTLVFARSDSYALPGAISGTGALQQTGSGTTILAHDSTYSGQTTVTAGKLVIAGANASSNFSITGGTLQIGNGGITGSIAGNVVDNAALAFNRSDTVTFAGQISGSGGLTQSGSGVLILTGANSYTGGTTIAAGALQLGDGGTTGGLTGNILDNGTFIADRSDTLSYSGVISGTGGLTQAGSGTLTLTQTNTYTGTTLVSAGTLSVNGSIATSSGVTVANGATLAGIGTVTSTNVQSGGTLSPGNSVGTLNISGNLNLAAGSTFDAEFTPTASDKVQAGGAVTIAGQLLLAPAAGVYTNGKVYTLITSTGALSGMFSNVVINGNFGGLVPTLSYDANDVYVTLMGLGQIAWSANPGSSDWNTQSNWTSNPLPGANDTALFNATTVSTIDIQKADTEVGGLQFGAGAPAYTFNVSGTATGASSLVIGATGIVDQSSNAPSFVVSGIAGDTGTLEFDNSATAGDATITARAYGNILFTGTTGAAGARLVTEAGGAVDISGLAAASLGAGSIAGSGSFVLGTKTLNAGALSLSTDLSGVISGAGALNKIGTGTLTLSGTNTYLGGTTISTGTLQLGNGGATGSIAGNVADNASLAFNRSDTATFGGTISGTGGVTKEGSGTLILSANNTYSGGTNVNGGVLSVNGSISSSAVTVNSGATLGGIGTVGTTIVSGGGILAPGNSIGTLNVNGNLTLAAGSQLVAEVGPSLSDQVAATGATSLAGNATVVATGGTYSSQQYTLISSAGGLSGTFASLKVVGTFGDFKTSLNYDSSHAYLVLTPSNYTWQASPTSSDWNVGANWVGGTVGASDDVTNFGASTITTIAIGKATGAASMTFHSGAPQYTFNIVGNASSNAALTLTTVGIVDQSANRPRFNVSGNGGGTGTLTFTNATSGDAMLTANSSGTIAFKGTADGGSSQVVINSGGTLDVSGLTIGGIGFSSIEGSGAIVLGTTRLSEGASNSTTLFGGVISGSGSIEKLGTGTLTLTGSNTYTGMTYIQGGTLQLGNGGTSGSVAGNVSDNASLVFNRSDVVTYGGVISGSGHVTQNGTGSLFLTGTDTYTGGTTITAGALYLGLNGTTGSIVGDVIDNAAFVFYRSDAYTFGGAISGTGNFFQYGSGTTTLTNTNTYTGMTYIQGGTLQLGNGGTSGSIGGNIDISGGDVLAVNRSDKLTLGGVISGAGGFLQQNGTGSLFLTGTNSYTGVTTINAGVLYLGLNGTTGSIAGNVVDNAAFVIYRSDAYTFGGSISGTGAFYQYGSGTTTLTNTNTYTGMTYIQGGTLQLGNGGTSGSIAGNIDISGGNLLAVNRSDKLTLAGNISGAGGFLQQNGIGSLFLTGTNTYTGGTTINAGALYLGLNGTTGSIVGDVVDNAAFVIYRSDAYTIGGSISGTGAFYQYGSGTTTLTNTNTYAGMTYIQGGTLQLGNGGTSGSITGNIDISEGHVLAVNRSDKLTLAGNISGTGGFVQQNGTGSLFLTGTNTYTGGTTINAGALYLGLSGTTGSIVGDVVNNAAFVIYRSDAYTFGGVISGTGAFYQYGSGRTTLTNTNTYTGMTYIQGGTLQLGNGGTSGSIAGNIDISEGRVLAVNRSDKLTLAGNISGTGGFLQQNGTGSLFLTGTNTYTGGTTINAGALYLGLNGTTGSIVGNVVNNAAFVIYRSDAYTFGGVISGAGAFYQYGSGTTTLTSTNTYTGMTYIQGGTLQLGNGGTSGSIAGNIDISEGDVLAVNRSDKLTLAVNISGAGGFVQQSGTGSLFLTGTNTYTGGTFIEQGTLEASNSNAVGSGAVILDVVGTRLLLDNGVDLANTIGINQSSFIDVNGSDTATISGALVGSAPFEKDGTGQLILNHDNRPSYSGDISYHGTLTAGVTGAFGTGTVTVLGSKLVLLDGVDYTNPTNLADDVTVEQGSGMAAITGAIRQSGGPWGLVKTGSGTLLLANSHSYTGVTTVSEGTLVLLGSVAGDAIVRPGATLATSGTVAGALTVLTGGTVSSVGSGLGFSVLQAGSFRNDGGTLAVRFAGGSLGYASDSVVAREGVSLAGGLVDAHPQSPASDFTFNQRYQIISTAAAVNGSFSNPASFTANAYDPSLTERLRYDLGGVVLEIRKLIDFTADGGATTRNQVAVANAINASEPNASDSWANVVNALAALSPQARQSSLDAISGRSTLSALAASQQSIAAFNDLMQSHLLGVSQTASALPRQAALGGGQAMWTAGLDSDLSSSTQFGPNTFTTSLNGTTTGFDMLVSDRLQLGFAAATSHPMVAGTNLSGQIDGDAAIFGIYGRYALQGAELALTAGHIETTLNENRLIRLGNIPAYAAGRIGQRATQIDLSLALPQKLDLGSFEPVAQLRYLTVSQDSFSERSAIPGLALDVAARRTDQLTASFGARWREAFDTGSLRIVPDIGGFVSLSSGDLAPQAVVTLQGAPDGTGRFRIAGDSQSPLSGTASLGLGIASDDFPVKLDLAYAATISAANFQQAAQVSISIELH